jgi:hypothetical protein
VTSITTAQLPLDQVQARISAAEVCWVLTCSADALHHLRETKQLTMHAAGRGTNVRYDRLEVLAMLRRRLDPAAAEAAERRLLRICLGEMAAGVGGVSETGLASPTGRYLDHELLELVRRSAAETAADYDAFAASRQLPSARQLMARLAVFRFQRLVAQANAGH